MLDSKTDADILKVVAEVKKKKLKKARPLRGTTLRGLTLKQEAFAQHYAKNGNGVAALKHAYAASGLNSNNKTIFARARRLTEHPKIIDRVNELRRDFALSQEITVESLIEELGIAVDIAKEIKAPAAIVQAVLAKAKLLGMLVDKTESKSVQFVIHAPRPEPTTAAWLESIRGEARELPDDSDDMKLIN